MTPGPPSRLAAVSSPLDRARKFNSLTAQSAPAFAGSPGGGGQPIVTPSVLTGKAEVQVEILNPWRYAATIVARCMTHETRDTGIDKI